LANERFGAIVTDQGPGAVWCGNSQANRLVPWSNDPVVNPAGTAIYLFDPDLDVLWTPTSSPAREPGTYRVRHGQGYSVFEHRSHGLEQAVTVHVPPDEAVCVQHVRLTNLSNAVRTVIATYYAEWVLGTERELTQSHIVTSWDTESDALFARNSFNADYGTWTAFAACTRHVASFTADRAEFIGRNGTRSDPIGARDQALGGRSGGALDPCVALKVPVTLAPGETVEFAFLLGQAETDELAHETISRFRSENAATESLDKTTAFWDGIARAVQVQTPCPEMDLLFNRWLPYQNLACRIWGRTAFYQSGGAFGFRDQLQDCTTLVYSAPHLAREHILRAAARQFVEGDVQHWWHPQNGAGVRTRITDDLLWLPYVVAHYVRTTGDRAVLDVQVPFLKDRPLEPDEHERYSTPEVAEEQASLLEHCRRATERAATSGPHGLPLIGGGDWNDGLSNVGVNGKGESVWLAWFLAHVMFDFGDLTDDPSYRERAKAIAQKADQVAWDGKWYSRGFYDDGTPLGSSASQEAQIDSLPQSWAVICGMADHDRSRQAVESATTRLVDEQHGTVLLFTPPFERSPQEPGYIKSYPPGVRENGGQYTHASVWLAMAWARLGRGDEAVRLLRMLNPINHSDSPEKAATYLVEPYVVAADVYSLTGREGMGGWTWYTGAAGWMYRVWLEEVLGFRLRDGSVSFAPVIPDDWPGFTLTYRYGSTTYRFEVTTHGSPLLELDGKHVEGDTIDLRDDGSEHSVRVVLGTRALAGRKGLA
jgi:cyclic beta-1,2-glucan synthetase